MKGNRGKRGGERWCLGIRKPMGGPPNLAQGPGTQAAHQRMCEAAEAARAKGVAIPQGGVVSLGGKCG